MDALAAVLLPGSAEAGMQVVMECFVQVWMETELKVGGG